MRHKRHLIGLCVTILSAILPLMGQEVDQPRVSTPTTFAIVIDQASYDAARAEVDAYRTLVEEDGLGTYLIRVTDEQPEPIRALLEQLHKRKASPLEGCVLIGDVPVTMIRDAQHLTSAFKMDQERHPWHRSSVPSDRYYDCFGLSFERLEHEDPKRPHLFYYSLRSDGEQQLHPDIYSARIRPCDQEGEKKHELLSRYLRKVVRERRDNGDNTLDHLSMARGHSYNSESKQAWAGEQLALREQLPGVFATTGRFKALDYDDVYPAKPYYLAEVQQPELDVMLFHHHGAPLNQYLNGYREGSTFDISKENIRLYARAKARRLKKDETPDEAIGRVARSLDIPIDWISDTFDPKVMAADSLLNRSLDIYPEEIRPLRPAARLVMLDACFTGSYHLDESISEEYLFSEGTTITVQANSVNVIQDKWPDEMLGLLAGGVRVGSWHQQVMYLETHLLGDPTFHFHPDSKSLPKDLSSQIVLKSADATYWLHQLRSPSVDLQALALRMLYEMKYADLPTLLLETYKSSESMIVRAEAVKLLSRIGGVPLTEALKISPQDSYELIQRMSIELIGKNGSDRLIPVLVRSMLEDPHSKRVSFKQAGAIKLMDSEKLRAELDQVVEEHPFYPSELIESLRRSIDGAEKSRDSFRKSLLDPERSDKAEKDRIFVIRGCRNAPDAALYPALLEIASDSSHIRDTRLAAIEALGWYHFSYKASEIASKLHPLLKDALPEIRKEAEKSIRRLSVGW